MPIKAPSFLMAVAVVVSFGTMTGAMAGTALAAKADTSQPALDAATRAQLEASLDAAKLQEKALIQELRDEQEVAGKDMALLWQAAVERSATLRYAIERLSQRDATGKPVSNDSVTRRLLSSIARIGGVASAVWTGNPLGMMGGNFITQALAPMPTSENELPVTETDMLILAKEVEGLQNNLLQTYLDYRHARVRWQQARLALDEFKQLRARTSSETPDDAMAATLGKNMTQAWELEVARTQQAYISARDALSLMTGAEAVAVIEQGDASHG